jgi:hypothetical protein
MAVVVSEAPSLETCTGNGILRLPSAPRPEADIAPHPQSPATVKPPAPEAEAELAPMYYV